jgi:hypothetical protein
MATLQTPSDIARILAQIRGYEIVGMQVLGVNSLKSFTPSLGALAGQVVTGVEHLDRTFTIRTMKFTITFDLQRTGRVVWLDNAAPYVTDPGTVRPTVRMVFTEGAGIDLTEPAKTKRISVTIAEA